MADNVQAVNDANFQTDVIEASKTQPVMVDFWADWCRPCHMLSPTVEEIARENAGKLKVVKLNVDENINAAGKFNIRGIPTLLVFKGGQVAEQIVGARAERADRQGPRAPYFLGAIPEELTCMQLASRQIPVRELYVSRLFRSFFTSLNRKSSVPEDRPEILPKYFIFPVDRQVL